MVKLWVKHLVSEIVTGSFGQKMMSVCHRKKANRYLWFMGGLSIYLVCTILVGVRGCRKDPTLRILESWNSEESSAINR